jgi:hypothetical protein
MEPRHKRQWPRCRPPARMQGRGQEDGLTTQPSLRDGAQQARLQEQHARWMGLAVFVIVLLACLVLQ